MNNPYEEKIRRLQDELDTARSTVIDLAPDEFHALLSGFKHTIETRSDVSEWQRDVIEAVVDAAKPIERPESPGEGYFWSTDVGGRGACPLCRSTGNSQSWGKEGWLLPGGLEKHLNGDGRIEHCSVMKIARSMLVDRYRDKFGEADRADAQQIAARKQTEPMVFFDPNREPEFLHWSKYQHVQERLRTPEQLAAVDGRLRECGFRIEHDGNVVTYRFMIRDDWMVLADPHENDRVNFLLLKRSGKHSWNGIRRNNLYHAQRFRLLDQWQDWPRKFQRRVDDAVAACGGPPRNSESTPRGPGRMAKR